MPFKKKSTKIVGRGDWAVEVPTPPKHATHARMEASDPYSSDPTPKEVTLPIQDFGCFKGVAGEFYYLRMDNKKNLKEEYDGAWYWNGYQVSGIEEIRNEGAF
jgi:hypothetical protein